MNILKDRNNSGSRSIMYTIQAHAHPRKGGNTIVRFVDFTPQRMRAVVAAELSSRESRGDRPEAARPARVLAAASAQRRAAPGGAALIGNGKSERG